MTTAKEAVIVLNQRWGFTHRWLSRFRSHCYLDVAQTAVLLSSVLDLSFYNICLHGGYGDVIACWLRVEVSEG